MIPERFESYKDNHCEYDFGGVFDGVSQAAFDELEKRFPNAMNFVKHEGSKTQSFYYLNDETNFDGEFYEDSPIRLLHKALNTWFPYDGSTPQELPDSMVDIPADWKPDLEARRLENESLETKSDIGDDL